MTYHIRNKPQVVRRHIKCLESLIKYLENKPQSGIVVAQVKALYYAVNQLKENP